MGFVAVDRAGFDEGTPRGWWASSLLGLLCAVGAYLYMGVYQGFMCAVVLNAVVLPGVYHKAVLVLCLGAQLRWAKFLFRVPTWPLYAFFVGFMAFVLLVASIHHAE